MNERLPTSQKLYDRAVKAIPGGVNSPVRAFRSVGGTPIFMSRGEGYRITDVDGNEFIDFCCSWGPLIHGHRHPDIMKAIERQMHRALTFGTPCEAEVELAEFVIERLQARIPTAERIRFVSSGTEAVMSALRLARGFTGRSKVIKFEGCYHGHVDSMLVKAGSGLVTSGVPDSAGVPASFTEHTIVLPLDDLDAARKAVAEHGKDLAAIILEPIPANNGLLLQRPEFLQGLRRLCDESGALLIFDEVISGFRVAAGGAAEYYKIAPDLLTYGKIIGGGMPVGAFAGRADVFAQIAPDGPVYQAGTLSGNPVAMSAGLAQLRLLTEPVYKNLAGLGELLKSDFNAAGFRWKLASIGSIFWLYESAQGAKDGDEAPRRADQIRRESMETYARLHRHCLRNGIYMAPSGYEVGFLSAPMSEVQIYRLLEIFKDFFSKEERNPPQ
ncbi:MAG: glutamate-1-semialdehyde 2,1-aminomutase [bacterium]|nr:glutamate-1-semialdehyde 2,1-aminomutase [bacterium]